MSDTGKPNSPSNDAGRLDTESPKAAPPVPVTVSPEMKAKPKIVTRNKKQGTDATASSGAPKPRRKPRFSRKQVIIGLIAIFLIFDAAVVSIWFMNNGRNVAPNNDPYTLIQGQLPYNQWIARIGYDSGLTFSTVTDLTPDHADLTIVNTSSLKPIENDLFKGGAGPDGADLLYDELIVGRIIKLNSDWVTNLNEDKETVFDSVQKGSPAQTKLTDLGAGSKIAYHQLAIGEIRHSGKNYYALARATYTLTKDGKLDIHEEVFVYKLVAQGNTLVIVDFEVFSLLNVGTQTPETPVETPEVPETPESTEGSEGDGGAQEMPEGEQGEGQTEEQTGTEPQDGENTETESGSASTNP